MQEETQEKSLFEILDFVLNPKNTKCTSKGIVFIYQKDRGFGIKKILSTVKAMFRGEKLTLKKDTGLGIKEILSTVNAIFSGEKRALHIHDAAVFSAYFGIPRDEVKRPSWDKLSFDEKVCKIKNDFSNFFSNGGYTSFTKIL